MNLIRTFRDLMKYEVRECQQFWYYVFLVNPHSMTKAGEELFDNLKILDLDSGSGCQYFIPGFYNTGRGLASEIMCFFLQISGSKTIRIPSFGNLEFVDDDFVEFYNELETRNQIGWRYSGGCELLLFNLSTGNKILLNSFHSYNLDDIVRNGRNIYEFIRTTINIGKDVSDETQAKQILDEKYYEMIMPDMDRVGYLNYESGWQFLQQNGFQDNSYLFLSYSSKDFRIVSEIRNNLLRGGVSCWMAPYDIPSGMNYALIIEHAIKHAGRFALMLSPSAVESVWVGKELKRAIARFQLNTPEKISIVWLNGKFPLQDTPFALPLEDIQISHDLSNDPKNYYLLLSEEKRKEQQIREKVQKYEDDIDLMLNAADITDKFRKMLSRFYAIGTALSEVYGADSELSELCIQLK